jgi:hypothetical protein
MLFDLIKNTVISNDSVVPAAPRVLHNRNAIFPPRIVISSLVAKVGIAPPSGLIAPPPDVQKLFALNLNADVVSTVAKTCDAGVPIIFVVPFKER